MQSMIGGIHKCPRCKKNKLLPSFFYEKGQKVMVVAKCRECRAADAARNYALLAKRAQAQEPDTSVSSTYLRRRLV